MTETEERSEKWKLEDPTLDLATTTSSVFGKMPLFPMSALLTVSSPWYLPQLLLRNISDFFFFDQFSFYLTYLMKKWHPDRYARNPGVAGEAKRRFQQIQEAYSGHFTLFSPSLKISF